MEITVRHWKDPKLRVTRGKSVTIINGREVKRKVDAPGIMFDDVDPNLSYLTRTYVGLETDKFKRIFAGYIKNIITNL